MNDEVFMMSVNQPVEPRALIIRWRRRDVPGIGRKSVTISAVLNRPLASATLSALGWLLKVSLSIPFLIFERPTLYSTVLRSKVALTPRDKYQETEKLRMKSCMVNNPLSNDSSRAQASQRTDGSRG